MNQQNLWRTDLQSADVNLRATAAEQLCLAGAEAAPAAVELVRACGDEEDVQHWAVAALEEIGPPPLETRQPLTELLSDPHPLVAYWAATLLGRLGPAATASQAELADVLLHSQDAALRERAAWALGKLEATSDVSVTALKQAAATSDARLSRLAQAALAQLSK